MLTCLCTQGALQYSLWNVYLVANGDGDWSENSRYSQAHLHDVMAVAKQHTLDPVPYPRIIAGDFNITHESTFYQTFVQSTHIHDVFGHDQTPTFHAAFLAPDQQAYRIDYLFLDDPGNQCSVKRKSTLFQDPITLSSGKKLYLSDHVGLWIECNWT